MGLLSRLFGFKHSDSSADTKVPANYPDEYKQILKFSDSLNSILGKDRFIARSDYDGLVKEYSSLPPFIDTLKKSQMLKTYVESNNLDMTVIERFYETYRKLADITNVPGFIKKHNDEFVQRHLKGEKKYLDEYKSYLEDQRDALKESLDKRKEAYSDYFESINQQADDEDFEEKESTLIANISKLATSGSADAVNQQAKLEQELAQLEKERLEELRQRAQDAVMENIDKTIEDIDQKFDKLLNSQQALLNAMNGDLDNPGQFLSNMIGNKIITEGLTDLQLTDYIKELQATYGSLNQFAGVDWNSLGQVLNTLNLNVNGTTINNLTAEEQQSVYTAIMTALQQVGLR